MKCLQCDYMMSVFDEECPRCHTKVPTSQATRQISLTNPSISKIAQATPPSPLQHNSTTLANFKYCNHCGAPNPSDAIYCAACGKLVSASDSTASVGLIYQQAPPPPPQVTHVHVTQQNVTQQNNGGGCGCTSCLWWFIGLSILGWILEVMGK